MGEGLDYALSRWQDPETGRFTSLDPARDALNWYAYCANNPLGFVDPTGLNIKIVGYTSPMGNDGKPGIIYYSTTTGQYYNNRYSAASGEIAHIGDYLTRSHIENTDKWQRYVEAMGGYLHENHCNEIALYQMSKIGYDPGRYSQNDSITTAVEGYKSTGETTALPTIGTVGYIYYYGKNEDGTESWNHQERYEYDPEGNLVIYRTSGQEVPQRTTVLGELTKENIKAQTWSNKTNFLFVATDKYDPNKSTQDTSQILADFNKYYPDSGWDAFVAHQISNYSGLPVGVTQPNLTQAQIDAEEKGESYGF